VSGAHGGHSHVLFVHGESRVHELRPQCKLAATVLFILAVVVTPREAFWAFAAYAILLAGVAVAGKVPIRSLVSRLRFELPFVAFAFFLPLVGQGRRIDVLGVSLSVAGIWGAWNIVIKGTIGVVATALLGATTSMSDLLVGLERLKVPRVFVAITGSMMRYGEVITNEMRRMKIARQSRGYEPRWMWQSRALASSAGALFVRSFERGERVYLAMASRGYDGSLPALDEHAASRRQWVAAMTVPAIATVTAILALGLAA
jgi:cobalt/nickel transport system permease protein